MMGKGAEGGLGAEESCCHMQMVKLGMKSAPSKSFEHSEKRVKVGHSGRCVDVYSQALKALAVRATPGADETGAGDSLLSASSLSLKPLSSFENKRKNRAKKTQVPGGTNKKYALKGWTGDPTAGQFWVQMEDYFREITTDDIQLLFPVTSLPLSNVRDVIDPCLLMLPVGRSYRDIWSEEDAEEAAKTSKSLVRSLAQQSMTRVKRKLLAASPASKKKKVSSPASEVITTMISPPESDDDELCHVCYGGDSDEQNQILFCDSCNVAVHQECYGVREVPEGQWICSWCSHRSSMRDSQTSKVFVGEGIMKSHGQCLGCVLCPVKGGALKPVAEAELNPGNRVSEIKFAHLFCCQWVPETYIQDTNVMEPIRNVEGVREERWKLLCSICKEKHGACIQCSHGMCATAFHPLCAREAKLRMEVSSKEGNDDVDLRAFCSKHSMRVGKSSISGNVQSDAGDVTLEAMSTDYILDEATLGNGVDGLGVAHKGGIDGGVTDIERTDTDHVSQGPTFIHESFHEGKEHNLCKTEASESLNPGPVILGSTADSVTSSSKEADSMGDARSCRTLDTRSYVKKGKHQSVSGSHEDQSQDSSSQYSRESHTKSDPGILLQQKSGNIPRWKKMEVLLEDTNMATECGKFLQDRATTSEDGMVDNYDFASKARSEVLVQFAGDTLNLNSLNTVVGAGNGQEVKLDLAQDLRDEKHGSQTLKTPYRETTAAPGISQLARLGTSVTYGREASKTYVHLLILKRLQEMQSSPAAEKRDGSGVLEIRDLPSSVKRSCLEDVMKADHIPSSLAPRGLVLHASEVDGVDREENTCNKPQFVGKVINGDLTSGSSREVTGKSAEAQWKLLQEARKEGVLDMAPADELENEILALQNKLITCAKENQHCCEQLILKVITNLSNELQSSQRKYQDLILVSHYLDEAREAKKQGRKERRHKEAQAVLAAATAAAAASPRLGSSRRDGPGVRLDEDKVLPSTRDTAARVQTSPSISSLSASSGLPGTMPIANQLKPAVSKPLKVNIAAGRPSSSSRTTLRVKGSVAKQVDAKVPPLKSLSQEQVHLESWEALISCDICGSEGLPRLNKIIFCHRCKVAVHQDCYGISRVPNGAWYCQPCAEIRRQFQGLTSPEMDVRGRPGLGVQCALCWGQSGAFKRSTDGRWVHIFCAQWMPETTVGKDQTALVEGLETVPMERFSQVCSICHREQGACLRCNFGHCHGAFHPVCARDFGLYMSVKSSPGGRVQFRAYCERHSPQQREKAESRRCGSSDELNGLKQIRVELERVRLICERIIRRERLKRDLLNCTKDICTVHMNSMALSAIIHSPRDNSTVLHGTEILPSVDNGQRASIRENFIADNLQKGSFSGRPRRMESESYGWQIDTMNSSSYQKLHSGDCDSQNQRLSSHTEHSEPMQADSQGGQSSTGVQDFGRQIDTLAEAAIMEDDQKRPRKYRKQPETLHREVVMTPTEASVQNQRLPKGYAYVPVVLLSKGKVTQPESGAQNS